MIPKSPVKLWTGPSDRRAPCGPWGQPVDNVGALPTACPHSRASRPRTSQDPQTVISGRERRGLPTRLTSPEPGGRFNRRGHFIQPEYTLFPPSNCPTNQDHLRMNPIGQGVVLANQVDATVTGIVEALSQPSHLAQAEFYATWDVWDAIRYARNPDAPAPRENWFSGYCCTTYVLLPEDGSYSAAQFVEELQGFGARRVSPDEPGARSFEVGAVPLHGLVVTGLNTTLFGTAGTFSSITAGLLAPWCADTRRRLHKLRQPRHGTHGSACTRRRTAESCGSYPRSDCNTVYL